MTNLKKILVPDVPDDKKNLSNYEFDRLLSMNEGITILFHHMFWTDPGLGSKDYEALANVLSIQSLIQDEIRERIPNSVINGFKE